MIQTNRLSLPNFWKWPSGLVVLFLATHTATLGLEQCMDIRFYDEGYYLTQGLFRPASAYLADYAPLYSLFYKAMGLFEPNPIALYYQSYRFWSFLLAVQIWVLVWKRSDSWVLAIIWAIPSLGSELSLVLWPKVGHMAMILVVIGLWGLDKLEARPVPALSWIFGICLLASWVRPEFIAGAGAAGILAFVFFLSSKRSFAFSTRDYWVFIPLFAGLGCFWVWGLPVGNSGRSLVAFGQHYVHNWRNMTGLGAEDLMWDWVNWRTQFTSDFGNASSLIEALMANPGAFFQHIFFNLKQGFYKAFIYYFETLIPNRWTGAPLTYLVALLWIGLEWKSNFSGLSRYISRFRFASFLPLLWVLPSALAALFFQPRPHYLLPALPVFLWFAGGLLKEYRAHLPGFAFNWTYGLVAMFSMAWFLPSAQALFRLTEGGKTYPSSSPFNFFEPVTQKSLSHKLLVENLNKYRWPENAPVFDASTGATEFVGPNLKQCGKTGFEMNYSELADFEAFLRRSEVRFIFLHETIRYDHFFRDLNYFQKLRKKPGDLGWQKIPIGQAGDSLLIKSP